MAIIFQEYSGQYLCRQHFEEDVESKAKREIRRHKWITSGDHIAVALSGDASSSALLCFLKKLTSNRRDIRISAITVDVGIAGNQSPDCALKIAGLMGTDCILGSFKDRFGRTLDDILHKSGPALSCTYCRVLRNFLLNRIAMEHGVTKIALGDTLDQGALLVLKHVLKGEPDFLAAIERGVGEKIPRIRPFLSVPRKEIEIYAGLHVKGCNHSRCKYSDNAFEEDVQSMLNEFTVRHPATKYALMSLEKNLAGACGAMAQSISSCSLCGEMTDGICPCRRIIDEVTANDT